MQLWIRRPGVTQVGLSFHFCHTGRSLPLHAGWFLLAPTTLNLKTLSVCWRYSLCMVDRPVEVRSLPSHLVPTPGAQQLSTSDWQELMNNAEVALSILLPRVSWWDYAPVASGVIGFAKTLSRLLSFLKLFPFPLADASWDLLPNTLLAFQSVSQVCLWENRHLQWEDYPWILPNHWPLYLSSFSRAGFRWSRRWSAPPTSTMRELQPQSHFSCFWRSLILFLEGPAGLNQCCEHSITQ